MIEQKNRPTEEILKNTRGGAGHLLNLFIILWRIFQFMEKLRENLRNL
jgi:hypothetical protein